MEKTNVYRLHTHQPNQSTTIVIIVQYQTNNIWKKFLIGLFVLSMIFGCCIESTTATCPTLCECKWKSGKESVVCLNANLSEIPNKLDASTQILNLNRNEISQIPNDAFIRANLLNLQKLYLTKCRLKQIERYAFRKLINLVELDLSENALNMIPSQSFESIAELRELKLIGNPIHRILNDAFVNVPQLIRLELSNCRIGHCDVGAFAGLESSLEWLKLDGNNLMEIGARSLTKLENLHGLELAGNPWNCSCNLRPLREWMIQENIPYNIPPVCNAPARLFAKTWDKIDLDEYACIPSILASDVIAHGIEGKNITMSCMVGGVPEPNVRWMIRNRIIANVSGNIKLPAIQGRKLYMVNLEHNASNLTILTADIQDAGTYICAAENKAGRVEASVTLAISRKPPIDAIFRSTVWLASIIGAVLFVMAMAMGAICVVTVKRRQKIGRWNTQCHSDSYEKIELNNKPNYTNVVGKSGRTDCTTFMKVYAENGIAVVGQQVRRNGDYRTVPSEDDGTDCFEDNGETNNANRGNIKLENVWNVSTTVSSATASTSIATASMFSRCAKNDFSHHNNNMEAADGINMKPLKLNESDLHIPRLIEFSDSTPDSSIDLYEMVKRNGNGSNYSTSKSNMPWPHHLVNRKRITLTANGVRENASDKEKIRQNNIVDGRASESAGDNVGKYPDLLDISGNLSIKVTTTSSSMAPQISSTTKAVSQVYTQSYGQNGINKSMPNNPFGTLPARKKQHNFMLKPISSESQSALLSDTSSQYGSRTFADSHDLFGRPLSNDAFANYPFSFYGADFNQSAHGQRSNSFLNLTTQSSGSGKFASISYSNQKHNPSLPTTPTKGSIKFIGGDETPLLDFSTLRMHKQATICSGGTGGTSSSSSTQANAYDYHAAQLERFLDEYRNLQEQLCKMKETCDNIRQKEDPLRIMAGNSCKVADPIMFSATALTNSNAANALASFGDGPPANPKGILKNKVLLPKQAPDPPPYWLHRNAMLKRLQDPNNDFFHS